MHQNSLTYTVKEEENKLVDGSPTKKKKLPKTSTMKRLLTYTFKHKCLLVAANISLIFTSIGIIALPYLAGQIVDLISKDKNRDRLNALAIQFCMVFLVVAIFSFIRGATYNLLGEKVVLEMRNSLFTSLLHKDIEFYDRNRSGELISRITSDVTLV
jgi:ABC-type multidrug transport system fused ATPase/permease subunit